MQNIIQDIDQKLQDGLKIEDLSAEEKNTVIQVISLLDTGHLRIAEKKMQNQDVSWVTHAWMKQAILIYFRLQKMELIHSGDIQYFDKIPLKKWNSGSGVRVVPGALARVGSYLEKNVILMPSFINIGAYVGEGTMVDTWATVGSCAQIGKHVHLSGGVGIGGVLEPAQAQPVIVEDHAFIGSRCVLVEGVHIGTAAVLAAGVVLTASTRILDVRGSTVKEHRGHVPDRSVVIPGTFPKKFPAAEFQVPCALIISERSPQTDLKTSLNQALREIDDAGM
jgi:2,3,4,5-tetrahydropyridine-2-carboxylate N-succinyltransferase